MNVKRFNDYEADRWWDELPDYAKSFLMIEYSNIQSLIQAMRNNRKQRNNIINSVPLSDDHERDHGDGNYITGREIQALSDELDRFGISRLKKDKN